MVDQVAALNALFETLSAADKARSMGRANRLYNTERHDVVIGMTCASVSCARCCSQLING